MRVVAVHCLTFYLPNILHRQELDDDDGRLTAWPLLQFIFRVLAALTYTIIIPFACFATLYIHIPVLLPRA